MRGSQQQGGRRWPKRAQERMETLFSDVPGEFIWHRKRNDGYTTVPRTLPIAMQVIDAQSKGKPAGHTLLCLWARSPDHALLCIDSTSMFAAEVGFSGGRAVDTWRKRMKVLCDLGFIRVKAGASGAFHYALLINPNVAVEQLRSLGKMSDGLYVRFIDRLREVGAHGDIDAYRRYIAGAAATDVEKAAAPVTATSSA